MFTVNDFISKFENYSNEQLIAVTDNPSGYSEEAIKAAEIIINKRGGAENLLQTLDLKKTKLTEERKIRDEINKLGRGGVDTEFMKKTIKSDILSSDEIEEIIEEQYAITESAKADEKITGKTIAGSVIGGLIAAIVGGALWGISLIYSGRIFYLLLVGLALLCYLIIKGITRQSKNNLAVVIATIISFMLAIAVGWLLYSIVGYKA